MTLADALFTLITNGPGRTESELAQALFGQEGYQQRVNQDCRLLVDRGLVRRVGEGGNADPYRYEINTAERELRETPYAREEAVAELDGARIERLFVHEEDQVEIRFSWWKDGRMAPRPLDVPEDHLLRLLRRAIDRGVFGDEFLDALLGTLIRRPRNS